MNYSGFNGTIWQTGLAYSTNLTTWTKEATNPVFNAGGGIAYIAANGSIAYKSGTYYLLYHNDSSEISLATSSNLLSWTLYNSGTSVIAKGGGAPDDVAATDPCIELMGDGTFRCYYLGKSGSTRTICWATSSDAHTWAKQGVLVSRGSDAIGEPYIMRKDANTFFIWHDESYGADDRYISGAGTTDGGSTFTNRGVLFDQSGSGWDAADIFDSCPVIYNGTLYLFYGGAPITGLSENMGIQIGVATSPWTLW